MKPLVFLSEHYEGYTIREILIVPKDFDYAKNRAEFIHEQFVAGVLKTERLTMRAVRLHLEMLKKHFEYGWEEVEDAYLLG